MPCVRSVLPLRRAIGPLVLGLAMLSPAAFAAPMAPPTGGGAPPVGAPGAPTVTHLAPATVHRFVRAYRAIHRIHLKLIHRLATHPKPAKAHALEVKAQHKMLAAVSGAGLTVARYNRIASLAQTQPAVRQQIIQQLQATHGR